MTSLLGKLLRLFPESVPLEDLFTEAVARLFETRPRLCLAWLRDAGLLASQDTDYVQESIRVESERAFSALEHHDTDSRPDLLVEVYRPSKDSTSDIAPIALLMFESKIGSKEGPEQLRRYAEHLGRIEKFGNKALVYITRGYDPKDSDDVLSGLDEKLDFKQLRWHDFYRFLTTVEKDALVEEVMIFMEEQGMARSYHFATSDLLAISKVPRVFETIRRSTREDVKGELEAFTGNKVKGQTHGLNHIRWDWRYIIIASLQDWDLFCFIGYTMDEPDELPGITVNLESRPNGVGRNVSVAVMRGIADREDWEDYNLENPSEWAGVYRWKSLADFLSEEDHVAAVKHFFIESIRQLKEGLTAFKKENPDLPWSGGS